MQTNELIPNKINESFAALINEIKKLYSANKYLEVIELVNKKNDFMYSEILDVVCLDKKIICIIYQGLAYIELNEYQMAIRTFLIADEKYQDLKDFKQYAKHNLSQFDPKQKRILQLINAQIALIKPNLTRLYSNLAYAYYKNKNYSSAEKYYKKALIRDKKNCRLHLELSQNNYKRLVEETKTLKWYNRFILERKFKNKKTKYEIECKKTLDLCLKQESNFENLLAIAKLYFFIEENQKALNYVQKALELNKDMNDSQNNNRNLIFAYDWLSRIAYKEKNYLAASQFYEKLIELLLKYSDNNFEDGIKHHIPKLSDMAKYLNETKHKVTKSEIHYINKTIWGGILAGIVLESAEIIASTGNISVTHILTIMLTILFIGGAIFINVYK